MTSFEKELKRRIFMRALYAICMGITVIVAFILKAFVLGSIETLDSWDVGILVGMFVGAEATAYVRIAQSRKALKNPEVLEALHIKEMDERNRIIALKTSRAGITLAILLLALSAIVASFINKTVFLTIGIILVVLMSLHGVLKLYYSRKI